MDLRRPTAAGVCLVTLIAVAVAAGVMQRQQRPATAAGPIDASGYWVISVDGGATDTCGVFAEQTGTALTWAGSCTNFGPTNASGTIDPSTGAFTASGPVGALTVTYTGTVAKDGNSATGTWSAGFVSGTFDSIKTDPPTPTDTPTPTSTPTDTATPTPCPPEGCPTDTPTPTGTATFTPTSTRTPTDTPTPGLPPDTLTRLHPADVSVGEGGRVVVQVQVASVVNLAAFGFTLSYDPAVLTPVFVYKGPFLATTGRPVSCLSPLLGLGELSFGCVTQGATPAGPSGGGVLATVVFVASCAAGASPIDFRSADLATPLGGDIPTRIEGAAVTVEATGACATAPVDSDLDGCPDAREVGPDATLGGRRDPANPWDFYDVDGDGAVNLLGDLLAVAESYGTYMGPSYVPVRDRTGPPSSAQEPDAARREPWDLGPPDGFVNVLTDVLGAAAQFGHHCT